MQLHDRMNCDCSFWGYENSPQAFEMCKPKATERLQFRLGDIRDAEDRPFDLMLVLDVIEHLEDYFGLLRDLRPRSQHTIFHIPLDLSVQTVLRKGALLKRRDLHAHLHYFTKETALQTLRDTGYELQDFFYTPRSVELGEPGVRCLQDELLGGGRGEWGLISYSKSCCPAARCSHWS